MFLSIECRSIQVGSTVHFPLRRRSYAERGAFAWRERGREGRERENEGRKEMAGKARSGGGGTKTKAMTLARKRRERTQ